MREHDTFVQSIKIQTVCVRCPRVSLSVKHLAVVLAALLLPHVNWFIVAALQITNTSRRSQDSH